MINLSSSQEYEVNLHLLQKKKKKNLSIFLSFLKTLLIYFRYTITNYSYMTPSIVILNLVIKFLKKINLLLLVFNVSHCNKTFQ